jgi:drug/metabolite transporter (DMT)-like permease
VHAPAERLTDHGHDAADQRAGGRPGKRPPAYTIGTVAVALFGVSLVICKGDYGLLLHGQAGRGDLLALARAVCWVVYTRGGASFTGWSPLRYTTLTASLGSITIAAATAIATATGYVHTPSTRDFTAAAPQLLYLIVIAAVLAVFTWNLGIRRLGPQNGILFMNLVPVTTFTVEIVRGYRPGTVELAGALVTVAALVANNLLARRSAAPPLPARLPAVAQPARSAA